VHPYAHPQHLKVLRLFVYIQYGCGMQSMGVFSLNHDTATSYRLGHTPFSLKFTPTCTCNTALRMHPYAHPRLCIPFFIQVPAGPYFPESAFFLQNPRNSAEHTSELNHSRARLICSGIQQNPEFRRDGRTRDLCPPQYHTTFLLRFATPFNAACGAWFAIAVVSADSRRMLPAKSPASRC
jgi:hypothetical protein